jgi:formate C-acetyltransferase
MLVMVAESYPGPGLSFGRLDQLLLPFYQRDLAAGRLDRARAKELLECFWVKPNSAYDYQARLGRNQGINSSFGQLVTLGGCGPDGADRANELTWLMLDVIEEMNLLEPKPNVRLHAGSPPALVERVAALCAGAQGSPVLLNFDEASMAGLRWAGLPEADLWDYAPVGCLENTRQGDDRSGTVDVNLDLAKAVELVLFDLKHLDPERHAALTGIGLDKVLAAEPILRAHRRAQGVGGFAEPFGA